MLFGIIFKYDKGCTNKVYLEEERQLFLLALICKLVHRLEELLQGDGPGAVLVEDPEGALHEERLQQTGKLFSTFVL